MVLRVVDQIVVHHFNGPTYDELVSCFAFLLTCNKLHMLLVETALSSWYIHTLVVKNIFRVRHHYVFMVIALSVLLEFEIENCPRHLIYNGLPFNHVFFKFAFFLNLRLSM